MEEKLVTTRELKVGEFYTYKGDDDKEKNLSRVGYFTNSTSGPVSMIYVVREVVFGKGQKKLEVISLDSKYSTNKTVESKYISLEKGERDLNRAVWYQWNNHGTIDMWFSDAGCVLDRKLKRAFPEYKMRAPNMMFGDIVVEVNTGIILSIDKVIGGHIISRLYYDKEKVLSNHDKYLILRKSDSRFRLAMTHEISLLSKNLPVVIEAVSEEDGMYLEYLRTVLDNKLDSRIMQRLEAGCTFKVECDTFIGPGMYLYNGDHIPTLEFGDRIRFKEKASSYPICSVTVSNNVTEYTEQMHGNIGRFDPDSMKFLSSIDIESYFNFSKRENHHGYLLNARCGIIARYEDEKSIHDYLQTEPTLGNPGTGGPIVKRLKYNGPGDFEIVSNNFYQEIICNGPWRTVRDYDVPMLDEIFEYLEKSSRKKVVERPITVMVNGKEVKVGDKLMKELKKLVK